MSHFARSRPRLVIGPAAVATFAAFELRHAGLFDAVAGGWCVFVLCVFAIAASGSIQLKRSRRRLELLRDRRAGRTR